MVAFSCCEYDGGEEERHEMDIARERSWRGKFRRRGRVIRPGVNRMDGKCPLTPLEVSNYNLFCFSLWVTLRHAMRCSQSSCSISVLYFTKDNR